MTTIDDPVLEPDDDIHKLSSDEMIISKLHFVAVTRWILEGGAMLNESQLLKVDEITKPIVKNEIGYMATNGKQPTNRYDTEAEYQVQLDLLYDAVAKVAPKAKASSGEPTTRPQPVARKVRRSA